MKQNVKRIIAAICFIMLMYIDKVVGTESQFIWFITNNLVGVVFSILIMSAFSFKSFIKPFYIIWSVLGILGTIGGYAFWYANQIDYIMAFCVTVPLNIWFLGMVAVKYLKTVIVTKELKLRFDKWEIVFALCCFLMLLSRSDYIWPIYYMIIFLMLWHAPFSADDRKQVFNGMLDGIIIGFALLQIYALVTLKYVTPRYYGAYGDCNRNACMYLLVLSATLTRMIMLRNQILKSKLLGLLTSLIIALLLYTGCRSAFAGIIGIIGVYSLIGLKYICKEKWSRVVLDLLGLFVVAVILLPVIYIPIRYCPEYSRRLYAKINELRTGTHTEQLSTDEYVTFGEVLDSTILRFFKSDVEDDIENSVSDYTSIGGSRYLKTHRTNSPNTPYYTLTYTYVNHPERGEITFRVPKKLYGGFNSFNHRINIYLVLLKNLNLIGHSGDELFIDIVSDVPGAEMVPLRNEQNFVLHFMYTYGIPVGLLVCALLIAETVFFFKSAKKSSIEGIGFLMFTMAYFCMGLMEVVWIPGQLVLILPFAAPFFFEQHSI